MSGIIVNYAALEGAIQNLQSTARGIDGRLNELESELAPLRSDWSGEAQGAYTIAKQRWDGAMLEMTQFLESTATTVRASSENFQSTDRREAGNYGV
ncbi:WXG100 family type VII secretion target [Nocardioides zeae]|uniref:ESAT-6-like protein n=1 Tax=Nocardioides imazamoxiresistens TaxID=3231893 RepID=A0ABU3PW72_9ACTN|nr:WXG100 family type VII secretion target [Nocardioides zeae]MDT9593446.1 WXG100 family type VII secretion target [Nocardioides zeae]